MSAPTYITSAQLKKTLSVQSAFTFLDDDIDQAVATGSRDVDMFCGRRFYPLNESNDETRYFKPKSPVAVEITDCYALTSLQTDQDGDGVFETTWTLHTDFELEPENADLDGIPWERIVLKGTSQTWLPYNLPRSVSVTGRFGWQTVPDGVVSLTTLFANRILMRTKQAPFGVVSLGVESAARIAKEDPDTFAMVRDLIRTPIFVG